MHKESVKSKLKHEDDEKDTKVAKKHEDATESKLEAKNEENFELVDHDKYQAPKLGFGKAQRSYTNEEIAADRERRGNINSDPIYANLASFLPRDVYESLVARDPHNAQVLKNLK